MSTFALIHGGAHGGWCWELVAPELEARGHTTVAPDLPFDDQAGATEWARCVCDALDEVRAGDDVVVVGHSLGGMCVPVVASIRPVRRMVFLGAMVPVPGRVYADYLADEPDAIIFDASVEGERGAAGLSWPAARLGFYQDLDEEVARRAFDRLRPGGTAVFSETCPIDRWPQAPSTYIVMTDDRAVNPAWSRRVARERLRAELIELPGGHSPFYSRPQELAEVLARM
jgi:pimeloyl-ACP methyl ester carboxylesterase